MGHQDPLPSSTFSRWLAKHFLTSQVLNTCIGVLCHHSPLVVFDLLCALDSRLVGAERGVRGGLPDVHDLLNLCRSSEDVLRKFTRSRAAISCHISPPLRLCTLSRTMPPILCPACRTSFRDSTLLRDHLNAGEVTGYSVNGQSECRAPDGCCRSA